MDAARATFFARGPGRPYERCSRYDGNAMRRITISVDDGLAAEFDEIIAEQHYESRSEAVRDIVRKAVEERRLKMSTAGDCIASFSYVYDHHVRALGQRLVELQHQHHDIVVSTTHVHLDHDSCLETCILRGRTADVRRLAEAISAERGVRFAEINLVSVTWASSHSHSGADHQHAEHAHLSPRKG